MTKLRILPGSKGRTRSASPVIVSKPDYHSAKSSSSSGRGAAAASFSWFSYACCCCMSIWTSGGARATCSTKCRFWSLQKARSLQPRLPAQPSSTHKQGQLHSVAPPPHSGRANKKSMPAGAQPGPIYKFEETETVPYRTAAEKKAGVLSRSFTGMRATKPAGSLKQQEED